VNFVIFLLLDSTADLGVNIEKEWDFSKGPKWMKWMTILMKFIFGEMDPNDGISFVMELEDELY